MLALVILVFLNMFTGCENKTNLTNFSHISNESIVAKDGETLFYSFFDGYEYCLMKSDLDGNNPTELVRYDHYWINSISVSNDWVYYNAGNAVYRIRTDGSDCQPIIGGYVSDINVVDEWVYYQKETGYAVSSDVMESKYSIWRIKVDGTKEQEIIDDGGRCLTVVNDYIYYLSYEPKKNHGNYMLYTIKSDGSGEKQILCDENLNTVIINDDIIYCARPRNNPNPENVFTIDLNGGNKKELDFSATSMFVYNNCVYYNFYYDDFYDNNLDSFSKLYEYSLTNGEKKEIIKLNQNIIGKNSFPQILFLTIVDDHIYFITPITKLSEDESYNIAQRGIFRCDISGENLILLSQGQ